MIRGFQGISLVDFPGRICSVVFVGGCNFRCPFCHNPELVNGQGDFERLTIDEVTARLERRSRFIEGATVTGGEPTLWKDLPRLLTAIRGLGLAVKLDTNGSRPKVLRQLIQQGLVDYVAMDIKTSLERYSEAAGRPVDMSGIAESIRLLNSSGVPCEFRTTCVPGLVDEEAVAGIAESLGSGARYTLQAFRNGKTLDPAFQDIAPFPLEELSRWASLASEKVLTVRVIGCDESTASATGIACARSS